MCGEVGVNRRDTECYVQLTDDHRQTGFRCLLYHLKEIPAALNISRHPKLLKNLECTQELDFCVFKPTLSIPDMSIRLHRAAQVEPAFSRVRLGSFDVGVCIVEIALIEVRKR